MILCVGPTPAVQRVMVLQRLQRDEVNRASATYQCAAGKATNVGRVLRTLGRDPVVTGFVGGDTGQSLRADLDATGIAHDFVTVKPPTRVCVTVIEQAESVATELVEDPQPLTNEDWDSLRAKIGNALQGAEFLVLTGSLPSGAAVDFYRECTILAHAASVHVLIDARTEPLLQALPAKPTIIKLNRSELAATVGFAIDSDEAIVRGIRALPAGSIVLVTLGANGALFSDAEGKRFWRLSVPRIRPVSTVGSGDSFSAGIVSALIERRTLPDAIAFGAACGVSNAMNLLPGQVRVDEIDQFLRQIVIKPVVI